MARSSRSAAPRRRLARLVGPVAGMLLLGVLSVAGPLTAPASAANVVTPGNFTGYGFDQCTAPTQSSMDAWLTSSPYWAVGIYVSGDSRGCLSQPNLTPTWISTQLAKGWRLLPITLGPQAWCTTRDRYLHQVRINPSSTDAYSAARAQGRAEADKTVSAVTALGIAPGSSLWYDLEAFDISKTDCRESALSFLSAWTNRMHYRGFVSGVYSSGASGIKMLDDARVLRPGKYAMPDQIWIADWNYDATTASSYVRSGGWSPHKRVHQSRGGHDETWGGVTINIDNDRVDLGRGSDPGVEPKHCGGAASYNYSTYATLQVGARGAQVKTVQCLLKGQGRYADTVDGIYDTALGAAVSRYRTSRGLVAGTSMTSKTWVALLSQGDTPLQKYGAAGPPVRRIQRALNAADAAGLTITGVYTSATVTAVKQYQSAHGLAATGVVSAPTWSKLLAGTT